MDTNSDSHIRNKLLGCLLGGAVGDALGAPVEFLSRAEIGERFGPAGIQDYAMAYGRLGAITDDTQMTLFSAEGLLRAYVRGSLRGIVSITSVVSRAYLRWLWTQGFEPRLENSPLHGNGWLWEMKELHSQRAPGQTCLSALLAMNEPTDRRANNNSKGAGGIMRVAPVSMMFAGQPEKAQQVFRLGMELAWLTHGHPSGFLSAASFAVILHALLCDEPIDVGIERACGYLSQADEHQETLEALQRGVALASSGVGPDSAIEKIGEAWVGEEALGVAVYCALNAENFRDGVLMAVNHDGDSDTTGSLVGQLLGAIHGQSAIPKRWLNSLELRETITQIAIDIADHSYWNLDYMSEEYDRAVVERYPGG